MYVYEQLDHTQELIKLPNEAPPVFTQLLYKKLKFQLTNIFYKQFFFKYKLFLFKCIQQKKIKIKYL